MKKTEIARKIETIFKKYGLGDTRIYFNNKAWDYDSNGVKTIIEDIKGSDCNEYSNDDTITATFEGGVYMAFFDYRDFSIEEELINMLEPYGYYYELGNQWNFTLHKI